MKKLCSFVSYRNIIKNDRYVNFEMVQSLSTYLAQENKKSQLYTIPPGEFPSGTLFSAYDIAKFLNTTLQIIDDCDRFYIIDNAYFDKDFTSIWTEAEFYIWSFYDRNMLFSKHKNKEKFYNVVSYSEGELNFSILDLVKLTKLQNRLLLIASSDFQNQPLRPDYSWPYIRNAGRYIIVCDNCKNVYISESLKYNEDFQSEFTCKYCGNKLTFKYVEGHLVCNQEMHSQETKKISIFDAIQLLFGDSHNYNNYPTIKL